ncbi:EscV/YscV/HrcV family type III secretion system export apparatus protein, partial [Mycobacterium tuberculosis]
VSQIPSLLVSIAAGIVITRVSTGERRDTQLANQIGQQLMAHPRALIIAGLAVASFLVVPGFPKWVFGLLAAVLLGLGFAVRMRRQKNQTPGWISHREGADQEDADGDHA